MMILTVVNGTAGSQRRVLFQRPVNRNVWAISCAVKRSKLALAIEAIKRAVRWQGRTVGECRW